MVLSNAHKFKEIQINEQEITSFHLFDVLKKHKNVSNKKCWKLYFVPLIINFHLFLILNNNAQTNENIIPSIPSPFPSFFPIFLT